ncbi:MAG: terminase small subunit [Nitrospirales bacterium]
MGRWIGNKADLAEFFQVSAPTIDDWVRRDCPVVKRGKPGVDWVFDFRAVRKWREAYIVTHAGNSKDSTTAQAVRRRALAEAGLKELELAKLQKSLADVEMIRRGLENVVINFRTMALSVAAQIGREIDDPEIRVRVVAIVDRRIREMLELMSSYDPVIEPHDEDGAAPDQPAGEVEAGPRRRRLKKQQEALCKEKRTITPRIKAVSMRGRPTPAIK